MSFVSVFKAICLAIQHEQRNKHLLSQKAVEKLTNFKAQVRELLPFIDSINTEATNFQDLLATPKAIPHAKGEQRRNALSILQKSPLQSESVSTLSTYDEPKLEMRI
jgi:hypothetical protein